MFKRLLDYSLYTCGVIILNRIHCIYVYIKSLVNEAK